MEDQTARKAVLALCAALAEANSLEWALKVTSYLAETADSPAMDRDTSDLIWDLISVIQPPAYTPRGILGEAFA